MVVERGQEDWDSEIDCFPRLFQGHDINLRPDVAHDHFRRADKRIELKLFGKLGSNFDPFRNWTQPIRPTGPNPALALHHSYRRTARICQRKQP